MPETRYHLAMPEPHTHLFEVEVRLEGVSGPVELVMPAWTPGSYMIREYARHVRDFRAADGAGAPLGWRRADKLTWRVEPPSDGVFHVRYAVYAAELTVRTSHLDASHGYVNGASVFLYAAGRERDPVLLKVAPPEGWRITTALARTTHPHRFRAADYDELVDSPLEIGTHRVVEWEAEGKPHRYAVWGRGNEQMGRLVEDTSRVVAATRELFRDPLPYDEFTFILHLVPGMYGGLEHRSSTSLVLDPWSFRGRDYERAVTLVAHELFHVWNGKRIRPAPLGPFDYTREVYTRDLWVVEGFTTYYTEVVLRRSGVLSPQRFLERLGEAISHHETLPGRHAQTLEDASFEAWIKHYRQDANTPNATISYYQKGMLVALLLDLRIRELTENRRSLDDVLRLLWERYGKRDAGFPEGAVQALAREVGGDPLDDFFRAHLRSTEELDFDRCLAVAGVERAEAGAGAAPLPPLSLGLRFREEGGRTVVSHVLAGTPAYRAGINAGDEVVALDGRRVHPRDLQARVEEREEGEVVEVALFRRDELLALPVRLERGPRIRPVLRRVAHPTPLQEAVYRGWLGIGGGTDGGGARRAGA